MIGRGRVYWEGWWSPPPSRTPAPQHRLGRQRCRRPGGSERCAQVSVVISHMGVLHLQAPNPTSWKTARVQQEPLGCVVLAQLPLSATGQMVGTPLELEFQAPVEGPPLDLLPVTGPSPQPQRIESAFQGSHQLLGACCSLSTRGTVPLVSRLPVGPSFTGLVPMATPWSGCCFRGGPSAGVSGSR